MLSKIIDKIRSEGLIGLIFSLVEVSFHRLYQYRLKRKIGIENIGKNVVFGKNVRISCPKIRIGDNVYIGSDTRLWGEGEIVIGTHTYISDLVSIYADKKIEIGDHCVIASFSFIIDTNHGIARKQKIHFQPKISSPIKIGSDVWIAASCVILAGANIEDGAVIGANSVVRGSVSPYSIVVGSPAFKIKDRT